MFGSDRKSNRRVHLAAVTALAVVAGGCAVTPDASADTELACPAGKTRICTYTMGREQDCACEPEEKFEEIFGPHRR